MHADKSVVWGVEYDVNAVIARVRSYPSLVTASTKEQTAAELAKAQKIERAKALTELFGKSKKGIADLLQRLETGPVKLPPGVTRQMLEDYQSIARDAVSAGKDKLGVQAQRRKAIEIILKRIE